MANAMRVSVYKMQTDDATKALLPCNGDKRGRGVVVCNMGIFAKNAVEASGEGYSALISASWGGGATPSCRQSSKQPLSRNLQILQAKRHSLFTDAVFCFLCFSDFAF